jgi:hypothetical protein
MFTQFGWVQERRCVRRFPFPLNPEARRTTPLVLDQAFHRSGAHPARVTSPRSSGRSMSDLDLGIVAVGFEGRAPRQVLATRSAATRFTICWYTYDDDVQRQRHRVRSARTMHVGLIGLVHTLSPWTPSGLNDGAVSARPTPTWPRVAHHPQLKGSPSAPGQRKRRRRMEASRSSDGATAGSGSSPPRAFLSLPW